MGLSRSCPPGLGVPLRDTTTTRGMKCAPGNKGTNARTLARPTSTRAPRSEPLYNECHPLSRARHGTQTGTGPLGTHDRPTGAKAPLCQVLPSPPGLYCTRQVNAPNGASRTDLPDSVSAARAPLTWSVVRAPHRTDPLTHPPPFPSASIDRGDAATQHASSGAAHTIPYHTILYIDAYIHT